MSKLSCGANVRGILAARRRVLSLRRSRRRVVSWQFREPILCTDLIDPSLPLLLPSQMECTSKSKRSTRCRYSFYSKTAYEGETGGESVSASARQDKQRRLQVR